MAAPPTGPPYRALETFALLFRVIGVVLAFVAALYAALMTFVGATTLTTTPANVAAVMVMVLPAVGIFLIGLLMLAIAEGISLATDCAGQLKVIAANTAKVLIVIAALGIPWPAIGQCTGDCNADAKVAVNELIIGVRMAVEGPAGFACLSIFDVDGGGAIEVGELVRAVGNAIAGCVGCPPINSPYDAPCRLPVASARCGSPPPSGISLDGVEIDSDGRLMRVDVLGLDPGLTYFVDVGSVRTGTITGVINSRFGVIEPAGGDFRVGASRDRQSVTLFNLSPYLTIDDCPVKELYGGF